MVAEVPLLAVPRSIRWAGGAPPQVGRSPAREHARVLVVRRQDGGPAAARDLDVLNTVEAQRPRSVIPGRTGLVICPSLAGRPAIMTRSLTTPVTVRRCSMDIECSPLAI